MTLNNKTGPDVSDGLNEAVRVERIVGGLPDVRFIKAKLPIADVAGELGLEVIGSMVRCWRPHNHQNGDRTPSVGIDRKRNRMRCFVCDARAYSAIDLVQKVLRLDTRSAIAWIAARFSVPSIPRGRHLAKINPFRNSSRVGLGGGLESVIRSGLWAQLTLSEKAVLPVLCELSDNPVGALQLSYKGIERFSGVKSDTTVARVLKHLEQMHVIEIRRSKARDGLRECNSFVLTLDDPRLHDLMAEIYESERQEVESEREMRREQRSSRAGSLANKPGPLSWLSGNQPLPQVHTTA